MTWFRRWRLARLERRRDYIGRLYALSLLCPEPDDPKLARTLSELQPKWKAELLRLEARRNRLQEQIG